jgi:hypothetical protein
MKCLWLSFLSLFLCNVLLAQHENYVRIVPQYGFVIPHRPSMGVLLQGHVRGMELDLVRHTNGSKAWQRLYRCPDYGMHLFIADLGNPSMLGQGYAVVPFIAFPILTLPHAGFFTGTRPPAAGHHFTHEERHDEAISRDAHAQSPLILDQTPTFSTGLST